ncbi:MAG: tryptophan-rich sensory protein, partial [Acidobacteria bacterium]
MNNHKDTLLSKIVVIVATIFTLIFNWLAASGVIGSPTGEISSKYPTKITPAKYAFSIWALIYAGLISFSIYQAIIKNSPKL